MGNAPEARQDYVLQNFCRPKIRINPTHCPSGGREQGIKVTGNIRPRTSGIRRFKYASHFIDRISRFPIIGIGDNITNQGDRRWIVSGELPTLGQVACRTRAHPNIAQ